MHSRGWQSCRILEEPVQCQKGCIEWVLQVCTEIYEVSMGNVYGECNLGFRREVLETSGGLTGFIRKKALDLGLEVPISMMIIPFRSLQNPCPVSAASVPPKRNHPQLSPVRSNTVAMVLRRGGGGGGWPCLQQGRFHVSNMRERVPEPNAWSHKPVAEGLWC